MIRVPIIKYHHSPFTLAKFGQKILPNSDNFFFQKFRFVLPPTFDKTSFGAFIIDVTPILSFSNPRSSLTLLCPKPYVLVSQRTSSPLYVTSFLNSPVGIVYFFKGICLLLSGVSSVSSASSASSKSTRNFNFDSFSNFQSVNLINKSQLTRTTVSYQVIQWCKTLIPNQGEGFFLGIVKSVLIFLENYKNL